MVTETPFRLPLGGGSTDLPSYYEKYGGFIFELLSIFIFMFLKRLRIDRRIQFHYTACETVNCLHEVHHGIGREALRMVGIDNSISVTFNADSPSGTGLGSSGVTLSAF